MADAKIKGGLVKLAATPAANDEMVIVDVSDTTMDATGSTKGMDLSYLARSDGPSGHKLITGSGREATVPATGTVALLGQAQTFTQAQTIDNTAGSGVGLTVQGLAGQDIIRALTAAGATAFACHDAGYFSSYYGLAAAVYTLDVLDGETLTIDIKFSESFGGASGFLEAMISAGTNATATRRVVRVDDVIFQPTNVVTGINRVSDAQNVTVAGPTNGSSSYLIRYTLQPSGGSLNRVAVAVRFMRAGTNVPPTISFAVS